MRSTGNRGIGGAGVSGVIPFASRGLSWSPDGGGPPPPPPVFLILEDVSQFKDQEVRITATLSEPAPGFIEIELSTGAFLYFFNGETTTISTEFPVSNGGAPFEVSVASVVTGGFPGLDTSDTATVTPAPLPTREHVGSLEYASSGSTTKADIELLPQFADVDFDYVFLTFECVGGGQQGAGTSLAEPPAGGAPGARQITSGAWSSVPTATISWTIGAGGQAEDTVPVNGGITRLFFGPSTVLQALGGGVSGGTPWSPKNKAVGPGSGARINSSSEGAGGASNFGTDNELAGGATTNSSLTPVGMSATNPFQHGSGGGISRSSGVFAGQRGHGGFPGGGGGRGFPNTGPFGGYGGNGIFRIHLYEDVWP